MSVLTLAVAGGGKTQGIVDDCVSAPEGRRILVTTYTRANQRELRTRLKSERALAADVRVQGWFSFLLAHWVRPYLPRLHPGVRLAGLNFDGDPGIYAIGQSRFLDSGGRAYKLHLAQLALKTFVASDGAVLDRLGRIYDHLFVDEVQDLNGYDLEILELILKSSIPISMVGDVRQALLLTNPREKKNAAFKGIAVKHWFDQRAGAGLLSIETSKRTWRSNQAIADFADAIFDPTWGFAKTASENTVVTGHDGVFVVRSPDVHAYMSCYRPMCLRHNKASALSLSLDFVNFGMAKGLSADRVLIAPTKPIVHYLRNGKRLEDLAACALYVAVTRARFSVAFVSDLGEKLGLPVWSADDEP